MTRLRLPSYKFRYLLLSELILIFCRKLPSKVKQEVGVLNLIGEQKSSKLCVSKLHKWVGVL